MTVCFWKTIWVFKLKFLQCPSLNASEYQFFWVVQVSRSEIWRMPSWQREEQGRCLSCLVLDLSTTPQNSQPSHGSSFEYCFRRATTATTPATCSFLDRPFSCGDHVVMFFPLDHQLSAFNIFVYSLSSSATTNLHVVVSAWHDEMLILVQLLSTDRHTAVASGVITSINTNSIFVSTICTHHPKPPFICYNFFLGGFWVHLQT
jgi:hypothetical protein